MTTPLLTFTLRVYVGTALALVGAWVIRGQLDRLLTHSLEALALALH